MKTGKAALGLMLLINSGVAYSRYSYITIYIPGRSSVWTVKKGSPYAVWNAHSLATAGSEVTVSARESVVDSAPLTPQTVFAADQDLVEGTKVWLPKNGFLVKMIGGAGNWYCTWRFDDKSMETQAEIDHEKHDGFGYDLCVQWDGVGRTYNAKIMISDFKGLLAITDPESGMGRYRNGIGKTDPVSLHVADPAKLPTWTYLKIISNWSGRNGGTVCLKPTLDVLHSEGKCFVSPGSSIELAGGTYTLVRRGGKSDYVVRVDKPIDAHGIAPKVPG